MFWHNFALIFIINFFVASADTINVHINTNSPVHTVPPEFLSYDLDMSIIYGTNDYWKLNFSYIAPLATALGPAYLRFGGTSAERLVFKNITTYNNTIFNAAEVDTIYNFAKNIGWRLIIDLNELLRSDGNFNTSTWNSSNAHDFLNYVSSKGYEMDFELGNEPEGYPEFFNKNLSGKQIAQDYHDYRMLLNAYPMYKNSKIAGPALAGIDHHTSAALVEEIFANGGQNYIDYFTWHHYYMGDANTSDWTDPKVMDTLKGPLKASRNLNLSSVWLGETGSTWNNDPNADKFAAGFWWIDKLGLSALYGLDVVVRFVFFGGTQTLISDPPLMAPVPDYWLCFLHKKLVGQTIYNVTFEPANPNLRIYAASSMAKDGSITVYGMTLTNDTTIIDFSEIQNKQATLYLVKESTPGNLFSSGTNLNEKYLEWTTHQFWPNYAGNMTSLPLELPGFSQFFLVVNQTKSQNCLDGWYKETSNSNKCIKLFNQSQPMFAAKFSCTIFGTNSSILSIENAFENNEITQLTKKSGCDSFYTGLIRWQANWNATDWLWVNYDKNKYKNWKSGYPIGSATHFCSIFDAQSGTWMDTDCDNSYCYICQMYL